MIDFAIGLLLGLLIIYLVWFVVRKMELPEPVPVVVLVVLVIILLLWIAKFSGLALP